jgi:hypothetical protein
MGDGLDFTLTDPLPGSPEDIRREAKRLAAVGAELREAVRSLRSLALQDKLQGEFAGQLVSRSANLANSFETLATRYEKVGPILLDWAGQLEYAKDAAAAAARDARAAVELRRAALVENPADLDPVSAAMAEQRRRAALDEAERLWDLARRDLLRVAEYAERTGQLTAKAIQDAIDDDLKDPSGGFLGIKDAWRAVDGILDDHAKLLKFVATTSGWAATAAAIAAAMFPPVAGVAIGLSLTTTALDAALAASGNENWANVALDVAALKIFAAARRTSAAVEASADATERTVRTAVRAEGTERYLADRRRMLDAVDRRAATGYTDPAVKLRDRRMVGQIQRQADREGERAAGALDSITIPEPSKLEAITKGGIDEAKNATRASVFAHVLPGHPAAAAHYGELASNAAINRKLWAAGLAIDVPDKLADDVAHLTGQDGYRKFKDRFTLEVGSTW